MTAALTLPPSPQDINSFLDTNEEPDLNFFMADHAQNSFTTIPTPILLDRRGLFDTVENSGAYKFGRKLRANIDSVFSSSTNAAADTSLLPPHRAANHESVKSSSSYSRAPPPSFKPVSVAGAAAKAASLSGGNTSTKQTSSSSPPPPLSSSNPATTFANLDHDFACIPPQSLRDEMTWDSEIGMWTSTGRSGMIEVLDCRSGKWVPREILS